MKSIKVVAAGALVFCCAGLVFAAKPDLEQGVFIKNGGGNLTVNYYSAPTSVDWDNDGDKDLVVGQFYYGNIWLYLNLGTDLNPVFSGGSLIYSGASPITVTYG